MREWLRLWLATQADELTLVPLLASRSLNLQLQFSVLGQGWVARLREAPLLSKYLSQKVDGTVMLL